MERPPINTSLILTHFRLHKYMHIHVKCLNMVQNLKYVIPMKGIATTNSSEHQTSMKCCS